MNTIGAIIFTIVFIAGCMYCIVKDKKDKEKALDKSHITDWVEYIAKTTGRTNKITKAAYHTPGYEYTEYESVYEVNGVTYYKSYDANCSANTFEWYIKGFSFATDNSTGNNKFEGPSYLYFKILEEGCKYIQVPVTIKGTYCPSNNKAEFTYAL